jgi:predicted alpha/beta superfamily hydrolase
MAVPQPRAAEPIVLGTSYRLHSTALGGMRVVNVVLPAGYSKAPTRRFPVLYVIDGGVDQDLIHVAGTAMLGAMWGRSQGAIIVGVETQDRRRELTGRTHDPKLLKQYPTAGKSAAFRSFLRDRVKPMIATRFRTNGKDVVIGESLAGLFIVETWLTDPTLFGGYGAISPSLWWDDEALSKTAPTRIGPGQMGHPLYLAVANEGSTMQAAVDRLVGGLTASARSWCYAPRADLTHATIYHNVSPSALAYLLPPVEAADPEYGFAVTCVAKH